MKFNSFSKIILLFLIIPFAINAQWLNFRHFGAREGLVQSQVFTILQDDDGYLWFGTVNGASRYDGKNFHNFTVKDGLSANYIYSGLKDSKGNLWFGHSNGTVSKFEWQTREFCPVYIAPTAKDETIIISKIVEDNNDRIWFLTPGKGAFYVDDDSLKTVKCFMGLSGDQVFDVTQSTSGKLWFALEKYIAIYDPNSGRIDSLSLGSRLKNGRLSSLLRDSKGDIWIGTSEDGLFKYTQKLKRFEHYSIKDGLADNSINSLYLDNNNRVWINTRFNGVSFQYYSKSGKPQFATISTANGLVFHEIIATFEDTEGNFWFGTNGKGVSQLRDRRFAIWANTKEFADRSIWSVIVDRQNVVWVGSNKGLSKIDRSKNQVRHYLKYQKKDFGIVDRISEDRYGNIWFNALGQGIFRISGKTGRLLKINLPGSADFVFTTLLADKNNNVWLGTRHNGLLKYNYDQKFVTQYTRKNSIFASDSVHVLYEDGQGNIWIGLLNGGILKYNGKEFTRLMNSVNSIISMAEGPKNDFWFVDMHDQLFRYTNGIFENYTDTRGLGGQVLYSVIADSHSVWVGTSQGVARLNYGDSVFTHFGIREGFPIAETNENSVFKGKNGRLWFGTIDGAVCYYPNEERINKIPPAVSIRKIRLFYSHDIKPTQDKFSFRNNHLTFDFIGISLTVPERVRYRYFLEGFDNGWSPDTELPSVTYSNLPHGKYNFKVIACNNDGLWNEIPAEYKFEILAPFWRTWWFNILSIIITITMVYLFIQWRVTAVRRMNVILGKRVENRTSELRNEKEAAEAAYAALKESEAKFRTYTELTSSGIFIYQDDQFKYLNNACARLSGYSTEELSQKNIWDLVHPDYTDALKQRLQNRLAGIKVPGKYELKVIRKDETERWVDFSGLLIEHNTRPALLATIVDITERKLSEEALMSEKERLAVTLRSIGDGVIASDIKGNVTLINERAKEIMGCIDKPAKCENLNKSLSVLDEIQGAQIPNPIEEVIEGNGDIYLEKEGVLKSLDGKRKHISLAVSPLKDKYGRLIGVVVVLRNIAEKKRLEQELLKSQKLESVGVLAGGIAHDFNNILTAIIGNISLAKLNLDPVDKVYDKLEKAEKAAGRAQELTQQLLTFSKGGTPVKKTTSIEDLVNEAVGFVLSGSNVKSQIEVKDEIPLMEVDPGQISQVIQNLIINADQSMPEGGNLALRLKLVEFKKPKKDLAAGQYLQLDVVDQGIGIPDDHLNKIFDPFFTTKQTGSGLGLATSYSIIKKHNGIILVNSKIGKGTTFSIFLPVSKNKRIKKINQKEKNANYAGAGRVLIMDDELFILDTASTMLDELGFHPIVARDGQDTLEIYQESIEQKTPIKAVLMDLTIPGGMSGKVAIKKLLELDPQATVIVSSGYSSDPVMANYSDYGFKACLKKPYRINDLVNVMKELKLIKK